MERIRIIENGGVTSVQGFKAAGVVAHVKKLTSTKKDVALIVSDVDCATAGVFTLNKVHSKTIDICRENLQKGKIRAVVVNSGNANACVGQRGYDDAMRMTEIVAEELKIEKEKVMVSSTGVIGVPLPIERVESGIRAAAKVLSTDGGEDVIEAIMTTDLAKKNIAVELTFDDGDKVMIGAIAKGSGMIHPNMATMLGYVTSDVNIKQEVLQDLLRDINEKTFNMISVDRDTSTNDSLIVMTNGLANNKLIDDANSINYETFKRGLYLVLEYLAKAIARDGEGATKLLEVRVQNGLTFEESKKIGIAVITSPLVKTAIFGCDANWGRIIAAVGYSGADVCESNIDIYVGSVKVCENGISILQSEEEINRELKNKEIKISIDVKRGSFDATVWGCDLSYDYVKINADYRS